MLNDDVLGYPAAGPGVDYLSAGMAQYQPGPGTGVYPAAALASLAAAAAAGQHGTSPVTTGLLDQPASVTNPPSAGHCKY